MKEPFNTDMRLRSTSKLKKRLVKLAKKRETSMSELARDVLGAACTYYEQRESPLDPTVEQVLLGEIEKEKTKKPGTEHIARFQPRME